MDIIIVGSEAQMKQLREQQERIELEQLRAALRLSSLGDAQERFQNAQLTCETLLRVAEEAYTQLQPDEYDDFETALDKSRKLDRIEREHSLAIDAWKRQRARLQWETRQAEKAAGL